MSNDLTKKQRGFVKDYLETGIGTKAALNNYDVENSKDPYKTASVISTENLDKPSIRNAILEALSDELLSEKHLALLNKVDKEGEVDVPAVSKGLDMAYKIKGSYAPEKSVNVNVEVEASPVIKELTDKLNEVYGRTSEPSDGGITSVMDSEAQDQE